jgi:hypothetical protein
MISKGNFLKNIACALATACFIGIGVHPPVAHARQTSADASLTPLQRLVPSLPQDFRANATTPPTRPPEQYIDPTVNYGLSLVLPATVRKGLQFDAGYDRWAGLPTVQADYFLPIKGWNDKSLFLSPRAALSSTKETYSMGAGFRQLINSETVIGFHAFHDWERQRRDGGDFMKEVGVGVEFAVLPGNYSDLSFSVNAYLPANERITTGGDGNHLVKEKFSSGIDARVKFLFPALTSYMDFRLDARAHRYRGQQTDVQGYSAILSANTRDGLLSASVEEGRDEYRGNYYRLAGNLNLAFDWTDLLKGKNPFSAPYPVSTFRYQRKMHDSLYDRVARQHDLPTDRTKTRITLAANVDNDTVSFFGGFPDLPNSRVTVQTSQSPWQDAMQVVTDSSGSYCGNLRLPPGEYRLRLIHKATGRVSAVRTIVVKGSPTAP